ncbi:hypothetical protein BXY85_0628 [Roseivirga pacifica]|uniref:Alpha-2-macroglobulin family protein n=1 Tax=Roseivirga pacifica TaxID=1267423 RepID=A0A1I0RHF7_9BACT|nr:MG2 domain-containing protein [Roseivirga pacifica]RKQ49635.1 hypothetical protein BXY85_0628 [Roseivirga pacifica]SEW40314.1 hypothetical protein SAMN05216290_3574 [Roseivirga pacifica]
MQKSSFRLCLLAGILCLLYACSTKQKPANVLNQQADQLYNEYISAYTTGKVSSRSAISIQFAEPLTNQQQQNTGFLSFSPSISGETRWVAARTLEFVPTAPLQSGKSYIGKLDLKKLGIETKEELGPFEFKVEVIDQDFDLEVTNIVSDAEQPMRRQTIEGVLQTADFADSAKIKQALTFEQEGKSLQVNWVFDQATGVNHKFYVEGVERKETASEVSYRFNGEEIGVIRSRSGKVNIPSLNDFKVINARVVKQGDPYVLIGFSDPLDENQDLRGLITIEDDANPVFSISGNEVKLYTSATLNGEKRLSVFPGIKNRLAFGMKNEFSQVVSFSQANPEVRLLNNGVILPSTDGLVLPFEAINLRAVDVTVIQVFEKNVVQFLQTNDLGGGEQLRRVGRPVLQQRVLLDESNVMDLTKWNRFTLDLARLTKTEPGAIYQVRLDMRRAYALYQCDGQSPEALINDAEMPADDWATYDGSEYGSYDSYYTYSYGNGYSWSERDNPCHDSYYMNNNRMVSTNILASDLGVIAKVGEDRRLNAYVTDLKTTQPIANATVEVVDYQQEAIETLKTDAEGKVSVDLLRKPFMLVVTRGVEKGYLKLTDGKALSLSNFNVGGARVARGVQGFIYGERGVWRPGDDIYLNFILEDKDDNLPEDHPVIFELLDPSGTVKERIVRNGSLNGFYHFPTKTDNQAPTGNWLARVKVGGTEFTKRVKIETVKPNRLKIDLKFDKERITTADKGVSGDLNVKWLSGAPARNLKAEFDLYLNPTTTTFKGYENYVFDDKSKEFYSDRATIFSGEVNDKGYAAVNFSINDQANAPGMLMATFSGKVFEPGGDFSINQFSLPYLPYDYFVGIRKPEGDKRGQLLTDEDHTMNIVSVDAEGKIAGSRNMVLEVFKLNWRWWWDNSSGNLASYVGRNYQSPYLSKAVKTQNGRASVKVNIPKEDWGRYYIRVRDLSSGHSAGEITYFDWPGWAEASRPGGASMLNFSTDKESYEVGEKVALKIPTNTQGRALISVENGSKVVESFWLETKPGDNNFTFQTTKEMLPNAYVNVTLLQPHGQTRNDLPIRLYGIVPINVSDKNSKLSPQITMANVLAPESEVKVKVAEQNGKAMTYTIAVVDEGLLDITGFKTPNPWATFFARQALGVNTWDVYDEVIGAFNGDLSRLLALGGDGTAARPENAKANRFKPVVKHLGPFTLEAGKTAEHSFDMPNYVGSVRTMVIAGDNGAYGMAEKATPVRKPLMVLATVPRVLGPGETFKLPVNVFAMESNVKNVEVSIETNGLLTATDGTQKNITFDAIGDQNIDFDLKVAEQIGVGKIAVEVRSGRETAHYEVEVQVRNPNPVVTRVTEAVLQAGQSWSQQLDQVGMAGTNVSKLEISTLPPLNLSKRLAYLMSYPHGCIEQTTSAVFPQLFLSDLTELNATEKEKTKRNVMAAIDRIGSFQTGQGGFAYWPGQSDDNAWGTNYAGHFLLEAKDKGYGIPSALLNNWKRFQSRSARRWSRNGSYNDDLLQAYRLYTLAKAQAPELGAMNRLREDEKLSTEAKWRLAAAYALTGRAAVAKELIEQLPTSLTRKNRYYYYGSQVRDEAMVLETLGLLGMQKEGLQLLRNVANELSKDRWMSTQTTAYALLAIMKFANANTVGSGMDATYTIDAAAQQTVKTAKSMLLVDVPVNGDKPNELSVNNTGNGVLFVRAIQQGQPLAGQEAPAANGLRLTVSYSDRDGNALNVNSLPQGTDLVAEVSVYNSGTKGIYEDLALTQIFPSGWEILNERLNEVPGASTATNFDYQDIRDDRVMTYFDLKPSESKTFKVMLNATYSGRFYLPAVNVEAMYDNTVNAQTAGKWVRVERVN